MTEKIGRGDRQRGIARITLGLVAVIVVLLAVEGAWTPLSDAIAQSPDATPRGTASTTGGATSPGSPAPPAGTQIEFLNPSKYASPEYVSIKPDADGTYHLVAWVSQAPADASVVFEIQMGSNPARQIGIANRVGGPNGDTFELRWNLTAEGESVPDGNYVLRAVLFTGAGSPSPSSPSPSASSPDPSPSGRRVVDTDEEDVVVDRSRETLEILKPANPGRLGFYDPDGAGGQRPGFLVVVQTSQGAESVRVYYSTSPPGTEPSWTTCREQVMVSYSDDTRRIGCTVPESQSRSAITAVAAVAIDQPAASQPPPVTSTSCAVTNPTPVNCTTSTTTPAPVPQSPRTESGDAHRVADTYEADPRSVVLEGNSNATRTVCHELTARVLDQHGEMVWRANLDVHADGPADSLQFAVTDRTSDFRAPDRGSHDGVEPAWNCEEGSADPDRQQAEHQREDDDEKHIESLPNEGTDLEGEFVFALRSTALGQTEVTAWADEDDDDFNDSDTAGEPTDPRDPQAVRIINWAAQSPGSPQSPSPGSSTSGSAASASVSTASGSGSSPSTSPSGSPSAPTLNCEPETRTNATNTFHTITCTVNQPGSRSGVAVDVELTGANDADGDTRNTPDRECTTNESGVCTFRHGPGGFGSTTNPGTTVYRAWIDADDNDASREDDPTEGVNEFQQPGQNPNEPDNTDVVEKTWQQAPLDCFPEQDGNPTGTSHTVTCRAFQTGGAPQPQGTHIVAEATGANDPDATSSFDTPDFECRTNQAGECSFIHGPGPGGRGTTNQEGLTRYHAWIDVDDSNSTPEVDQGEGRDDTDADQTDVVDKTWTRNPTALTMEPESDSASVGSCNAFTITVTGDNRPVSGVFIDVEQRHDRANNQTNNDEPRVTFCTPGGGDGPNPSAVDQTQGDLDPPDENPDNPGTLGGETLTATDSDGRVTIGIAVEPANGSDGTGNVTVTAFFETDDDNDPEAGEPQDTSTKTWVSPEARTIVCQPESASNPVNTQHTVTCTVRDRFGAPVQGKGVTFTEDGPGDFTSRGTSTDGNGQVRAVTTSSQGGTQTITATIDDDLQGGEPGEVDDCDRGAGSPSGAPVGACSDSVTKTWVPTQTSPTQFERDVTIEAQKSRLVFGKNVTLGGTVESDAAAPAACTQFVSVDILRDVVGGASEFQQFASVQSDSDGAFSYDFRADVSANYVAQVEEVAQCGAATSDAEPVLVKVKVGLRLSDSSVRRGQRVRFTVQTRPCPATARDRVLLFRAIDGEFGKVGSKRTNDRCVKSFRRRVETDSVFQSRWPKQAEEFLAGKSRPKIVRIVGRRR